MLGSGFGLTRQGDSFKDASEGAQRRGSGESYEGLLVSAFCDAFLFLGVVSVGTTVLVSPWLRWRTK